MHPENAGALYYSVFSLISLVTAIILLRIMRREGEEDIRLTILPVMILGAIIGAKLPVIMSYGMRKEMLWTGKSYFGALVGAVIAMNIYKNLKKIKGAFGDRFVVPLCVSAGIGKIGCFIYGCCGGTDTDFFIKVKNSIGHYVHPVQIYESIFEFACAALFLILYKTERLKGTHFLLYLSGYSFFRLCIEFIRTEPRIFLGLTVYQIMAIIILPVLVLMIKRRINDPVLLY